MRRRESVSHHHLPARPGPRRRALGRQDPVERVMAIITVEEAQYFQLSPRVQELLRVYGGAVIRVSRGVLTIEVSDDRVDEILAGGRAESE